MRHFHGVLLFLLLLFQKIAYFSKKHLFLGRFV